MDPATATIIASAIAAAGSIGGGYLNKGSGKETKQQRMSRKVAEQLIAALQGGGGPFAKLFQTDEAAFQKSFVDPAKSMFKNQIAPQIQQQFIAGGQQRGTGLDDQLMRAGVDLDQMLNQNYMQFQQGGQDRMMQILQSVLGMGAGAAKPMSGGEAFAQSTGGYLSSDAFSDTIKDIMKQYGQGSDTSMPQAANAAMAGATPKGFAPDWRG